MISYNCCQLNSLEAKEISSLSQLLKLVGEENRLKLLCLLNQGEHCVCEILEYFAMSQSLVSHHLADLKKAGLIKSRKTGRQVFYALTKKGQRLSKQLFSLKGDF